MAPRKPASALPVDLAANLERLEGKRRAADAALAGLIEERRAAILDGSPVAVVDVDHRQALELAKVEQADARIVHVRGLIAAQEAEAAAAAKVRAYEAAKAARADGVDAVATIRGLLPQLATARGRLINAKSIVADANRSLPPGAARLVDPEGERVEAGFSSLLDQVRFVQATST